MDKLGVARRLLGTATDLFIRDHDPVSVYSLTCPAVELLESTPAEAQVLTLWCYTVHKHEMAMDEAAVQAANAMFPGIVPQDRREQKRRLRRKVEKHRRDPRVLAFDQTERVPLILREDTPQLPPLTFGQAFTLGSVLHPGLHGGSVSRLPAHVPDRLDSSHDTRCF